jgi:hypothetical protein
MLYSTWRTSIKKIGQRLITLVLVPLVLVAGLASPLGSLRVIPAHAGFWSGSLSVPGGRGLTDAALASTVYRGQIFLFGKGLGNNLAWMKTTNGTTGSGWTQLPGVIYPAPLAAAVLGAPPNDQLYLFAVGPNQIPIVNYFNGTTPNPVWFTLPGPFYTNVALSPVVDTNNNTLYLFAVDVNHGEWMNKLPMGGSWSGWTPLPGAVGWTDAALASTVYRGQIFLFGKGLGNGQVYGKVTDGGSNSTGWFHVPDIFNDFAPLAATVLGAPPNDQLYLFATTSSFTVQMNVLRGGWAGWQQVPGAIFTDAAVSTVVYRDPQTQNTYIYLFGVHLDHSEFMEIYG